jgi:hypothetical protein
MNQIAKAASIYQYLPTGKKIEKYVHALQKGPLSCQYTVFTQANPNANDWGDMIIDAEYKFSKSYELSQCIFNTEVNTLGKLINPIITTIKDSDAMNIICDLSMSTIICSNTSGKVYPAPGILYYATTGKRPQQSGIYNSEINFTPSY